MHDFLLVDRLIPILSESSQQSLNKRAFQVQPAKVLPLFSFLIYNGLRGVYGVYLPA